MPRDENLKCPQCYIWWPDMQTIAIHVSLCRLVNEARLIYNGLKRIAKVLEKAEGGRELEREQKEAESEQQHHGPHGE